MIKKIDDVVVIGGGMAGICAAIAAARGGARTALIQERPVLGGMASSEMRMHICGADYHMSRKNARETGILEEILLENKYRNPEMNYPIFDSVLWEKVNFQKGVDLFLNTTVVGVRTIEKKKIRCVKAWQMSAGRMYEFTGDYFVDATGDGTVGYYAGAEYRTGRESRSEFGESLAPLVADRYTMGNSLLFQAADRGHEVKYIKPHWAYSYTEEDLRNRDHMDITSGYWWIELGGDRLDTVLDAETIGEELRKTVYGIWDHIKNGASHGAESYDLEWVGVIPGKRESRRLIGEYLLRQADIEQGRVFEDAVAYGGWPMDLHTVGGLLSENVDPTVWNDVRKIYTIPYRCLYSKNIENLFMAGRDISCTHVAFASTRVMGTCAVVGQAVGSAAAMAVDFQCTPKEIGRQHVYELQQRLIRDDCYIPGHKLEEIGKQKKKVKITGTSFLEGCQPENVINGFTRHDGSLSNSWTADLAKDPAPSIMFHYPKECQVHHIQILFDSNLSKEITPSINRKILERQERHAPSELIKEFSISFFRQERLEYSEHVRDFHQRKYNFAANKPIICDVIRITIHKTHGSQYATVFEVLIE